MYLSKIRCYILHEHDQIIEWPIDQISPNQSVNRTYLAPWLTLLDSYFPHLTQFPQSPKCIFREGSKWPFPELYRCSHDEYAYCRLNPAHWSCRCCWNLFLLADVEGRTQPLLGLMGWKGSSGWGSPACVEQYRSSFWYHSALQR